MGAQFFEESRVLGGGGRSTILELSTLQPANQKTPSGMTSPTGNSIKLGPWMFEPQCPIDIFPGKGLSSQAGTLRYFPHKHASCHSKKLTKQAACHEQLCKPRPLSLTNYNHYTPSKNWQHVSRSQKGSAHMLLGWGQRSHPNWDISFFYYTSI